MVNSDVLSVSRPPSHVLDTSVREGGSIGSVKNKRIRTHVNGHDFNRLFLPVLSCTEIALPGRISFDW